MDGTTGISWFWRDARGRGISLQVLVGLAVLLLIGFLAGNAIENLNERGIATGFGFLGQPAGFDISFSLINYTPTDTHLRVLLVGMTNTLLVAALGIPAAMLLGLVLGVLRLSGNWLVVRLVATYVEIVRNVPLLLQIFFWQSIVFLLPNVQNSISFGDAVFLNKRQLSFPLVQFENGIWIVLTALALGITGALILGRWRKAQRERTGTPAPYVWAGPLAIIALPLAAIFLTGVPWTYEFPALGRFNVTGGAAIPDTLVCLWLGLVIYTAAFIAEVVRAGIQSVSKGQREAAQALGLKQSQIMNLVILPQALRVIIPPTTSQFLNLTKNSSLAVFVGYPDIVAVFAGTSLNQTGQAIEIIAIAMLFYLVVSLSISLLMNWYNRATALVER